MKFKLSSGIKVSLSWKPTFDRVSGAPELLISEKLGAVAFAADGALGYASTFGEPSPSVSPEVARAIDEAVRDLLAQARGRALAILTARRTALERTAQQLIEQETLEGPELLELLGPTDWQAAA